MLLFFCIWGMLLLFVYWEWCPYIGKWNDVVIWEWGMMLCLYWEYCYFWGIVDAVVCSWGMLLLFFTLVTMLLFGFW
jgi:hypothetical protein